MYWRVIVGRKQRGWSQTELAEKAGLQQTDISRIERGWTPPDEIQQRVAKVLNFEPDYLFDATATP